MNEPSILFLTRKAFMLLDDQGALSGYPKLGRNSFEARTRVSDLTLGHELEVMDVKAAFYASLATSQHFSLAEFCTWPLLYSFRARRSPSSSIESVVRPDGFIRIRDKDEEPEDSLREYFLEVDRSSETQDVLVSRAACYRDYYRSGGYAVRNGAQAADYKKYPFRVLIILQSIERRNNTAERLLENDPPILSLTWLTTLSEVTAHSLGRIWIRPRDYREAIAGTPFDLDRKKPGVKYRRLEQRDRFLESKIRKFDLLEAEAGSPIPPSEVVFAQH
jgi:hypothetical protein